MVDFNVLQEIFRDIFDDEDLVLTRETTTQDIENWDSLAQINLIVAIEKEWHIRFNLDEIIDLKNVGDMYDLIGKKLNHTNLGIGDGN